MSNYETLAGMADELGAVKAEIAELAEKESRLKKALIESGMDKIQGSLFQAAISRAERISISSDLVRKLLSADALKQVEQSSEVVTVRVSAKSKAKEAA
jgi:hypothetical protein